MFSVSEWRSVRILCIIWIFVMLCWILLNIQLFRHAPLPPLPVQYVDKQSDRKWNDFITSEAQRTHDIFTNLNSSEDHLDSYDNKPLLTLFTTMKLTKDRQWIHNNTIRNWAYLAPYVTAVLYDETESESLKNAVLKYGWHYRSVPKVRHGLPVVKAMFQDAIATHTSDFYGYANADILFADDLIFTLKVIKQKYLAKFPKGILLSGQRKNVIYTRLRSVHPSALHKLRNKYRLFNPRAQDYFITTAEGFPWDQVPDLVVGRPGWDNYLIVKSFEWCIPFIDTTKSISAFHQTGQDGNMAGFTRKDYGINIELTGNFTFEIAKTTCARFATATDVSKKELILYPRPSLGGGCTVKQDSGNMAPVNIMNTMCYLLFDAVYVV